MRDTYEGYELDISRFDLTDKDEYFLGACVWLVDNKHSLRQTSLNMDIPKSSIYDYIMGRLRLVSSELYSCCRRVMGSR